MSASFPVRGDTNHAPGSDWFLFNFDGGGGASDKVTDRHSDEVRDDIDIWL